MGDAPDLADEHRRALDRLSHCPPVTGFYLAGGTAIAFHLHHRQSLDLDFFSFKADADLEAVKAAARSAFDEVQVVGESDASLRMRCDGTPTDFVRYPYPPLEPPKVRAEGVAVAGLLDLSVMKLAAIARRGLRRDFWDLFAILCAGTTLEESAGAYIRRYGVAESDLYHVLRALTYFADAEKDPVLPRGMTRERWEEIKRFLRTEAPKLVARGY
jgi:hypothetical protein